MIPWVMNDVNQLWLYTPIFSRNDEIATSCVMCPMFALCLLQSVNTCDSLIRGCEVSLQSWVSGPDWGWARPQLTRPHLGAHIRGWRPAAPQPGPASLPHNTRLRLIISCIVAICLNGRGLQVTTKLITPNCLKIHKIIHCTMLEYIGTFLDDW